MLTILGVILLTLVVAGWVFTIRTPLNTALTIVVSTALVITLLFGVALLTGWRPAF
jgi:hypothetical protein